MKTDLAKNFDCSAKMGFQLHYCRDCGEAGKSRGHVLRCFSDLFFFVLLCPLYDTPKAYVSA